MKFITTSQTPTYKLGSSGFYAATGSIPAGTELTIAVTGIDPKSDRAIGTTAAGQIVYLDVLTKLLDDVEVEATFLWGWIAAIIAAVLIGSFIYITKSNAA